MGDYLPSKPPRERTTRHPSMVYFIKPLGLPYVKIGRTNCVCRRIYELQSGSPTELRVVALVAGGSELEQSLHSVFSSHSSSGEWFHFSHRMAAFLDAQSGPHFDVEEWIEAYWENAYAYSPSVSQYINYGLGVGKGRPDGDCNPAPGLTAKERDDMSEDARRHCHRCELPKSVCACPDADAYDQWWEDYGRFLPPPPEQSS